MSKLQLMMYVLKQPFYALITAAIAAGLGLLYYSLIFSIAPISAMTSIAGPAYVTTSIALTFGTAVMAGINISLLVYKIKGSRLTTIHGSGSTAFGSTLMAFTPGCPACTTPLIAVFSALGGIAIFPLQGLEFKIISVAALVFSVYWTLRSLEHRMCAAKPRGG